MADGIDSKFFVGGSSKGFLDNFVNVAGLLDIADEPVMLEPETSLAEALEVLALEEVSSAVVHLGPDFLGVFSVDSFSRRLIEGGNSTNGHPLDRSHVIDYLETEPMQFIEESAPLNELLTRLENTKQVFIKHQGKLLALNSQDLSQYLFDITLPFILIMEIEKTLVGLIKASLSEKEFELAVQKADRSQQQTGNEIQESHSARIEELTFGELRLVIIHQSNWRNYFSFILGPSLDECKRKLQQVNEIRNIAFHFKSSIDRGQTAELRGARQWIEARAILANSLRE